MSPQSQGTPPLQPSGRMYGLLARRTQTSPCPSRRIRRNSNRSQEPCRSPRLQGIPRLQLPDHMHVYGQWGRRTRTSPCPSPRIYTNSNILRAPFRLPRSRDILRSSPSDRRCARRARRTQTSPCPSPRICTNNNISQEPYMSPQSQDILPLLPACHRCARQVHHMTRRNARRQPGAHKSPRRPCGPKPQRVSPRFRHTRSTRASERLPPHR